MVQEHGIYKIGLKLLLRKGDSFLFLIDANTNHLDLPGGRINSNEAHISLPEILDREVHEELGASVAYKLGKPIFQYRRTPFRKDVDTFITVYNGDFISGDIIISDEHSSYQWVAIKNIRLQESDFGVAEEYSAMQNYFNSLL